MAAPEPFAEGRLLTTYNGTRVVQTTVPDFSWGCQVCGWLGTGYESEQAAKRAGQDHLWDEHGMVPCNPDDLLDAHRWKRVKGSDSTDQCERCGRYCGK